jgi:hypothetical protein
MKRPARRRREKSLRKIKLVPCDFKLTAASGLGTVLEVFDQTPLATEFRKCLPERVSHQSAGSYLLALMVLAGHLRGVEGLSDLEKVRSDPYLTELFKDEVSAIRTIGDFLRDFESEHIEKLNAFLNKMSRSIFKQLELVQPDLHKPKNLILDMDSTSHEHFGEKIEGLAWNYKKEWCLDTQVVFNSLGFCHGLQMRPGNTKSGVDAVSLMNQVFVDGKNQITRLRGQRDYFRADSAYCYQDVIKTCMRLGVLFTITAHDGTMGWKKAIEREPLVWEKWNYSLEQIKKAQAKGQELPLVEVSRYHWSPSWSEQTLKFPVVVKRTWTPMKFDDGDKTQENLFRRIEDIEQQGEWTYYAVVTNFDLNKWSIQSVFEHHAKRGNAENFVKEEKYNFKLKRFPCQKMLANHAWVLLAQVAHNLLRWIALIENPDRPHYSKKLRNDYIFSPGKLVSHAGQLTLKVTKKFYEEVMKLKEGWRWIPETVGSQFSSA